MCMVIGGTSFTGIIQEMDIFQPLITMRFVLIQPTLLVSKSMIVGRIHGQIVLSHSDLRAPDLW